MNCKTCKMLGGNHQKELILYQNSFVVLSHCMDVKLLGYLIISPARHIENFSNLTAEERNHFSLLLACSEEFIKHSNNAIKKVYVCSIEGSTGHLHFHVFPRCDWMNTGEKQINGLLLLNQVRNDYKTDRKSVV